MLPLEALVIAGSVLVNLALGVWHVVKVFDHRRSIALLREETLKLKAINDALYEGGLTVHLVSPRVGLTAKETRH